MKKATILAFACALFMGQAAVAQESAKEITYVNDPSQGYLFNRFQDNWFITAEGGAGIYFSSFDSKRDLTDRFSPAASIYVGKWFSPIIGLRVGANYLGIKGLTANRANGLVDEHMVDGLYKEKFNLFGPQFDIMLNLTNWWCGYRPGRVYNAYVYAGGGLYWTLTKYAKEGETKAKWHNCHDRVVTIRAGLTQEFNITKHFALGLDLRATAVSNHSDSWGKTQVIGEALLTATYKFNKTDWSAPIVPVCPPAENCDEYRARLAEADAKIADLENQLRACLNRPVEKVVEKVPEAPLATIYYPCDVYTLTSVDRKVLQSVANVMKDTKKTYVLTGWADNYTGNDKINVRLRHNRVNGVKNQLLRYGVPESQLEATTNNGNRVDLGDKCLTLDRCVTIMEK